MGVSLAVVPITDSDSEKAGGLDRDAQDMREVDAFIFSDIMMEDDEWELL